MKGDWKAPVKCENCTEQTKYRIETCGPDTNMKIKVAYGCENEDCEVKQADQKIKAAIAEADKSKSAIKKKPGRPKKK